MPCSRVCAAASSMHSWCGRKKSTAQHEWVLHVLIEVVYANAERSVVREFSLCEGATIADALQQAQQSGAYPVLDWSAVSVGIFGQVQPRERVLQVGDRVEIYRALLKDPKLARFE